MFNHRFLSFSLNDSHGASNHPHHIKAKTHQKQIQTLCPESARFSTFGTFDGDELLEVLHQMAIGQALDQGQQKHRIHLDRVE